MEPLELLVTPAESTAAESSGRAEPDMLLTSAQSSGRADSGFASHGSSAGAMLIISTYVRHDMSLVGLCDNSISRRFVALIAFVITTIIICRSSSNST